MHFLRVLPIMILLFLGLSSQAFAWNAVGHALVAQIAYDQLTPEKQKYWNKKISALRKVYPRENFIYASLLPDQLKMRGIHAYDSWHFINWPIETSDNSIPVNSVNIIWAIKQSEDVLNNSKGNAYEKAFFASFLIHLVGDAHQPLHCASIYNHQFPQGDYGGNSYRLKSRKFPNLHADWDRGAGFLNHAVWKNAKVLQKSAQQLESKYPPSYFGNRVNQLDPIIWTQESHDIAIQYAYAIPYFSKPTPAYQKKVQEITQEQITLAGYRLALLLNSM